MRLEHKYEVLRGGTLIAEGHTTLACVGKDGKLREMPAWLSETEVAPNSIRNVEAPCAGSGFTTSCRWRSRRCRCSAAALVFFAVPGDARGDYLERVRTSPIDWIILGVGFTLFAVQTVLAWRALRWQETDFDIKADRWLGHLSQAAEWFPLLGLIGTVAAILQTFSAIKPGITRRRRTSSTSTPRPSPRPAAGCTWRSSTSCRCGWSRSVAT